MKSILIIIPYFGKLPNYFDLFISSCKYNQTINWLIYTNDDIKIKIPENVKIVKTSFNNIKKRIQSAFDFHIALENPYKLCDYRPAYGLIFKEEIKDYDYWGYGDLDVVYGNIRKFIDDNKLNYYDRVYSLGHLSIFKNSDFINNLFMEKVNNCLYYKDVYQSKENRTFDEFGINKLGGLFQICLNKGIKTYNKIECADIDIRTKALICDFGGSEIDRKNERSKKHIYYEFDRGILVQHSQNNELKEIIYIHLQKRKMKNNCIDTDRFYIYPSFFDNKIIESFNDFGFNPNYIKYRVNNLSKRIIKK